MIIQILFKNLNTQSGYTGLKGINLTHKRFMVNKRDREENGDLNEDIKRLRTNSNINPELNLAENSNQGGDNINPELNSEENSNLSGESADSESNFESALSHRFNVRNRPEFYYNYRLNDLNREARSDERSIRNYYNSRMNNIEEDEDRVAFDNDFASRLIDSGNRDLVESITGINLSLLDSECEDSETDSNIGGSNIDPSLIRSDSDDSDDSDDGYHGGSEVEVNHGSDNNSEDNNPSGGIGLPSTGNTPVAENPEENLSGNPHLNTKNSLESEKNYSDLFSFVVFQILNALSFIMDIFTQIFFS